MTAESNQGVGGEVTKAERVVMALTEVGYGHLVQRWLLPSDAGNGVIKIRSGTIQSEDEARAMHRAIRLACGQTTPGNFEKWLRNEADVHGWTFPWIKDQGARGVPASTEGSGRE